MELKLFTWTTFISSCLKSSQGTVVKGEEADEPDAKRVKVDTASNSGAAIPSPNTESSADKKKVPIQKPLYSAKISTETPSPDPKHLKQRPYPFTTSLNTPMVNRYKLDNRPTTIKVVPPLPTGLADVCLLSLFYFLNVRTFLSLTDFLNYCFTSRLLS